MLIAVPAVTLMLLVVITFTTGKDIIKAVNEKTNFTYSLLLRVLLLVIMFGVFEIMFYKTTANQAYIYGIYTIHIFMTALSSVTDNAVSRINRHTSRVAYILNTIYLSILASTLQDSFVFWLYFGIYVFVIAIGFVFIRGIGSADFRLMLIIFPTLAYMYQEYSLIGVFLSLIITAFWLLFKQMRIGKVRLPIGDKLMGTSILNLLFGKFIGVF